LVSRNRPEERYFTRKIRFPTQNLAYNLSTLLNSDAERLALDECFERAQLYRLLKKAFFG